jgi:hypothetical protein
MANVIICDVCNTKIGSRTPDHTNYGSQPYVLSGHKISGLPRMMVSVAPSSLPADRGKANMDICEACVKESLLLHLGLDAEYAKSYVNAGRGQGLGGL